MKIIQWYLWHPLIQRDDRHGSRTYGVCIINGEVTLLSLNWGPIYLRARSRILVMILVFMLSVIISYLNAEGQEIDYISFAELAKQ